MEELKPCPFCGAAFYDLYEGESYDASAFWDSAVRGSSYGFIICECGAMIKASTLDEAKELWNRRMKHDTKRKIDSTIR